MKRFFGLLLPVLITWAVLLVIFGLLTWGSETIQAAQHTSLAGIVVTTLDDELNNDGDCSLREAIAAANTNEYVDACGKGEVLTDTITFSVQGTIVVGSQLTVTAGGPLVIDGGNVIATSGDNTSRVWWVENESVLLLKNITISNGKSDYGSGLASSGNVTIQHSTFSLNHAGTSGGGVTNSGFMSISDSTFVNNGALYVLTIHGGGVFNSGTMIITNSAFINNGIEGYFCPKYCWGIAEGGGIANYGSLTITNSTFSGNKVIVVAGGSGGGIYNSGELQITNSTFNGNVAQSGGGIRGHAILANTIIANSELGSDCEGDIVDRGHNLSSDDSCGFSTDNGSLFNVDPGLASLKDNGGSTWTHALLPGSPAIDAGDNAQCSASDQRGFYRPIDGDEDGTAICDIGSFEFGSVGPWGIHLMPPNPHGGDVPGATVIYSINLYNLTDFTDTYSLALGSHHWATTIFTDVLGPLPPARSQALTVTVAISPEAAWYQTDFVTITATSQTNPLAFTATTRITTRAQPPYSAYLPVILKEAQASNPISGGK